MPGFLAGEFSVEEATALIGDFFMSELKTCFKRVDYDLSGLLRPTC
jgi:hypothetical protein